ncbi:hypothetical protein [Merismopedia glauca]|uniref:Uncharacterized protein n=1 Tax=Merismopedia glauca CCAP 1448/3 TaxID=1296344 RepID=A0A2T1BZK1_9CYAN|nr:hypothetical protein [Merismopedia glauca]PSB01384.1 hypothetical protein C7B64_18520 [Merismopedia glauca CCAP 1448/3]
MAKVKRIAMITVYHSLNILETAFGVLPDPDCSVNIVKVAEVATDSLEEAFSLTNHIDSNWTNNPEVTAVPGKHRSTCVGDVLEKDGQKYRIAAFGFEKL